MDGEGREMPHYANTEYGADKYARNPANGGRWDLYNTGQFHRGITVTIVKNKIKFKQRFKNKKIEWLDRRLETVFGTNRALGVPKDQYDKQLQNILPQIKVDILIYLRNGKNNV